MKKIIFYLAFLGWISSYFIYLSTYAGIIINTYWIWILHLLVIVAWIPIIINVKEIVKSADAHFNTHSGSLISFSLFKYLFHSTPTWFIALSVIGIFITIESFITLAFNYRGPMQILNGEYFLYGMNDSKTVISEGEFNRQQAFIVRGHAGHWLLLLGLAVSILFKYSGYIKSDKV